MPLMRILLVEDEAAIADFMCRGLEAEGYAVVASRRGRGERRALAEDFDLVVLDGCCPAATASTCSTESGARSPRCR